MDIQTTRMTVACFCYFFYDTIFAIELMKIIKPGILDFPLIVLFQLYYEVALIIILQKVS